MKQLETTFRDAGMVIPFMHNEKGMRSVSWSTDYQDVGGAVEMYGLDSYPGGLSCSDPKKGFKLVRNYHEWFQNYSYTQPSFMPEFEGGFFQPPGGDFYDDCATELDPAFADVYYKNNIGQRVTLLALYMAYGGTNWGQSAAPVVGCLLVVFKTRLTMRRCTLHTIMRLLCVRLDRYETNSSRLNFLRCSLEFRKTC